MIQLPEQWRNDSMVSHFMRHVVPIYFDLRKDGIQHQLMYTAFVFSVQDFWVLMTAGHGITEMKRYRDHGYQLVACWLCDIFGLQAKHRMPVPFNYDDAVPYMIGKHETWDYGSLFINNNARALLERNGVCAFTEASWDTQPPHIDEFKLLGIPDVLLGKSPTNIVVSMFFARVIEQEQRPEGFVDTDAPMFYGQLLDCPISDLHGLSGSPIMAFAKVDGQVRYWLHAMQVSAVGAQYISGMLMRPLGQYLRGVIESHYERQKDITP